MTHCAGIDISLETSSICIVDAEGAIQREFKVESEPEAMAAVLVGSGFAFSRIGLEAGRLSQWLHAGLAMAGLPVVLLETRQLRATTKVMPVKTDRNDARAMAQVVRTGWYKAVHVKSELSQELGRKLVVAKLRDLDNGIRGLLRGFGLKVGQVSEAAFPTRVRELTDGHAGLEALIGPLLQARDAARTERERLHRLVLAAIREDDVCRRLTTVPGIGPVTALTFCSAVDDPARFSRSRAVGVHSGLTPRRYQSGETDRVGHISKQGDSLARQALYKAAMDLLQKGGGFLLRQGELHDAAETVHEGI
ncbi:IS110 family transposase, partial [Pseudoroseomonas wenyumeiae]